MITTAELMRDTGPVAPPVTHDTSVVVTYL